MLSADDGVIERLFVLRDEAIRSRASDLISTLPVSEPLLELLIQPHRIGRTIQQNRTMWSMLTDLSKQVDWYGHKLTEEEWKDVCTAALKQQKVVPGINGGFVVLGSSTKKMKIREMSDMIDLMAALGAERGVTFKLLGE